MQECRRCHSRMAVSMWMLHALNGKHGDASLAWHKVLEVHTGLSTAQQQSAAIKNIYTNVLQSCYAKRHALCKRLSSYNKFGSDTRHCLSVTPSRTSLTS